jgi:hypothetical protein
MFYKIIADAVLQKQYRCLVSEWRYLSDGGPLQEALIVNSTRELNAVVRTLKSLFGRGVHNQNELTELALEVQNLRDILPH